MLYWQELAASPDVVLISVSGQGPDPDELISTTSGGLRLLRLSHGTDLHIEDYMLVKDLNGNSLWSATNGL